MRLIHDYDWVKNICNRVTENVDHLGHETTAGSKNQNVLYFVTTDMSWVETIMKVDVIRVEWGRKSIAAIPNGYFVWLIPVFCFIFHLKMPRLYNKLKINTHF